MYVEILEDLMAALPGPQEKGEFWREGLTVFARTKKQMDSFCLFLRELGVPEERVKRISEASAEIDPWGHRPSRDMAALVLDEACRITADNPAEAEFRSDFESLKIRDANHATSIASLFESIGGAALVAWTAEEGFSIIGIAKKA